MASDNAGRSPSLRSLMLWWLLLMVLAVPGWFLVGYGLLTASLSIHLAGCFWAGFAYSPAMLALIGQRCWLPAMDWWDDSWRQVARYLALMLFSVCWYGLLIGSGIWRFG